jgi:hypothetical protein
MSTEYPELPVATQTAMKPPDDEALLRPVPAAFSQTPVCRAETGLSPDGINAFSQLMGIFRPSGFSLFFWHWPLLSCVQDAWLPDAGKPLICSMESPPLWP